MSDYSKELDFASRMAREAGTIMRENFTFGMKKEWKDDNSPLTATDLTVNQLVMDAVGKEFPKHAFIGEEGGRPKESEYSWVCDPVDGTIPFSHGYPTFMFSLALTKNGESLVGAIYDPILDRLITGTKGGGAFLNGSPIHVSDEKTLSSKSFIECDSLASPAIAHALNQRKIYTPTLYTCVYAGMLIAVGEFTAQVYAHDKPWDAAAVKVIVEEAGGKMTDLAGNEQRYDQTINGYVASNGHVHDELIALIQSAHE